MKPLIVIGAAPCLKDDMQNAPKADYDYMAIGLDAVDKYLGRIEYMATFHPDEIPAIKERRKASGGNIDYKVIKHNAANDTHEADYIMEYWKPTGSSALLGVQAALGIGYKKIILCGCPLEGENAKGDGYAFFQDGWKSNIDKVKDNVRSMSGWTKELLGAPDGDWLNA